MIERQAGPEAIVLGSAAGGGFPQWNCGCRLCRLVRLGDRRVRAATQASVAVTGDGRDWVIIGASPDLRQQLIQTPRLWPRSDVRDSPISGVVLLGGDIDAIAGLLVLRERQPFSIYAPASLFELLDSNAVFKVLDESLVRRVVIEVLRPVRCGANLILTVLPMPGKVPLYQETRNASEPEPGLTYAAMVETADRRMVIAPACADVTDAVLARLQAAHVVFFDGTLFTDDEMIVAGLSQKSGTRMGHIPLSGRNGSLTRLAGLSARRIFLHINNTNPILLSDSPERQQVEAAGFEVAYDGMEVSA